MFLINPDLNRKVITKEPHFLPPLQFPFSYSDHSGGPKSSEDSGVPSAVSQWVSCSGLTVSALKSVCWSPDPEDLRTWLCLEMGPLRCDSMKMGSQDELQANVTSVFISQEMRMQTHGGKSTWSPGEKPQRKPALLAPWAGTSGLRSCGKISVCCLSLWVWGALWWQPQQTNAVPKQLLQKRKGNLPSSPCPPCSRQS